MAAKGAVESTSSVKHEHDHDHDTRLTCQDLLWDMGLVITVAVSIGAAG